MSRSLVNVVEYDCKRNVLWDVDTSFTHFVTNDFYELLSILGTWLDVVTKVTLVKVKIQIDKFPRFFNCSLTPAVYSVSCHRVGILTYAHLV